MSDGDTGYWVSGLWDSGFWDSEFWDARDHLAMPERAQKMANYALNYGETNGSRQGRQESYFIPLCLNNFYIYFVLSFFALELLDWMSFQHNIVRNCGNIN